MKQKTQREVTVNESRHTPGPWIVYEINEQPDSIITKYAIEEWDEPVPDICKFTNGCAQEKANAYLIAAAPDMLEALKLTYDLLNVGQPLGNDDLDKIYAAIVKATNSK